MALKSNVSLNCYRKKLVLIKLLTMTCLSPHDYCAIMTLITRVHYVNLNQILLQKLHLTSV